MASDILVCARSAHPVLLHCLQDIRHDWCPLQLVNKSMCAAFQEYAVQVKEYTAKREHHLEVREHCMKMKALRRCVTPRSRRSKCTVLLTTSWSCAVGLTATKCSIRPTWTWAFDLV